MSRAPFIIPDALGTEFAAASYPALNGTNVIAVSRLYRKELLREGVYQHPVNPWPSPLAVTAAYIDELVASTNKAIAAGVDVWVPDTHSFRAEDNRGFVRRVFRATVEGDPTKQALFAELEITHEATAAEIGKSIRKVSVLLMDMGDGRGNQFGERVVHVALTPSPVATVQENFVALSIGSGTTEPVQAPVLVPAQSGDKTMLKPTEKISKALGIALDAELTSEAIEKGLDALTQRALTAETELATLKATPPPTVESLLSVDAKQPLFKRLSTERAKRVALLIDTAKRAGKVNEKMGAALASLLTVEAGFALSAESGAAAPIDVPAVVESLIEQIPANAVVPLDQQIGNTKPASGQPEKSPDPFDTPEKAKAEADRMLKSAGLVPTAK